MRNLNDMRIYTVSEGEGPSLLVVRDSFGERLFPYLANAASRMVYSRVYEDVAQQARDADARVVVLEIAERNLASLLP
jgi:phage baseplate assembly protein W